jgi:group I intron endonuclease
MIVYKTTNLINGKFYVGKDTKNKQSYLGSGKLLKQAIKKYGKENFKKEVLEHCTNLCDLDKQEIYWIFKTNAIDNGYNLAKGGSGGDTGGGGVSKGNIPWNKGTKGLCISWNKGSKDIMKKNQTSFKAGEDHAMFGKRQKDSTIQKRVTTRKANGSYKGHGKFAPKQVINIEDGRVFKSAIEAAKYYNTTRDVVGHSCRKQTAKGKFRFV